VGGKEENHAEDEMKEYGKEWRRIFVGARGIVIKQSDLGIVEWDNNKKG
jgi:hypothetical protein